MKPIKTHNSVKFMWLLAAFMLLVNLSVHAQTQLNLVEYFIDTDPGLGNGTQFSLGNTQIDTTLNIDLQSVSNGLHQVYVRLYDSNGKWSHLSSRYFIKYAGALSTNYIDKLEYSADSIVPQGTGNIVNLIPQNNFDTLMNISMTAIGPGIHTIYFRVSQASGYWSHVVSKPVIVFPGSFNTTHIKEVRYYFDNDQANFYSAPITLTDSLNQMINLETDNLSNGLHQVNVYVVDELERPSFYYTKSFIKYDGDAGVMVKEIEYFYGDSMPNNPADIHTISLTSAMSIDTQLNLVPPTDTIFGDVYLNTRVKAANGSYSFFERDTIEYCPTAYTEAGFDKVRFGNTYSFIDTSKYAESYFWDFGDGSTDSVSNPLHSYDIPNVYKVVQTVSNSCGSRKDSTYCVVNGIEYYTPTIGGLGDNFIEVYGGGLDTNVIFKLISPSGSIYTPYQKTASQIGNYYGCMIDLHNADIGTYDVEIITSDSTYLFPGGYIVNPAINALRTEIIGREVVRGLVDYFYTVRVHNDGNVKAGSAIVGIYIPDNVELTSLDSVLIADTAIVLGYDTLPEYFETNIVNGYIKNGKIYEYMVYDIPPKGFVDLKFLLNFKPGQKKIDVYVRGPYSGSPWFSWFDDCGKARFNYGYSLVTGTLGAMPGVDCAWALTKFLADPLVFAGGAALSGPGGTGGFDVSVLMTNIGRDMLGVAKDCSGEASAPFTFGAGMAAEVTFDLGLLTYDLVQKYKVVMEKCPEERADVKKNTDVRSSIDPNVKYGPSGYGDLNFIENNRMLDYSIFFENVDTASLPAQKVVVIDTLDGNIFDLASFKLTSFGFGTNIYKVPNNRTEYVANIKLDSDKYLRANLKFNDSTGVLTCVFLSLDSLGELLEDPLDGFLPPNVNKPEGEGFITYNIAQLPNLADGVELKNKATIIFDNNPQIETDTWINTIDNLAPVSQVINLIQMSDSTMEINVTGNDNNGSEIIYYDLYGKINNQSFEYVGRMSNSLLLKGEVDSIYSFYVIATDSVGNIETKTPHAEATITLHKTEDTTAINSINANAFSVHPNPSNGHFEVNVNNDVLGDCTIELTDMLGRVVYQKDVNKNKNELSVPIDVSHLGKGLYSLTLKSETQQLSSKVLIE